MDLKVVPHKKIWLSFSSILVLTSVIVISIFGLKPGIDFTGGTLLEIEFNHPPDINLVKELIQKVETEPPLEIAKTNTEEVSKESTDAVATEEAETTEEAPVDVEGVSGDTEEKPATDEATTPSEEPLDEAATTDEAATVNTIENAITTGKDDAVTDGDGSTATETAPPTEYSELNPEGIVEIGSPVIQTTGANALMIRIKYINEDTHKQILERLKAANGGEAVTELRYENIGPVIGETLKNNAMISLVLAIIFIILFISFAFRKMPRTVSSFKFGVTAVVALVHDVSVIVAVFAILGKVLNIEIDTLFVTALLTVMGFSVHDTIVVFDRIRENLFRSKGKEFSEVANDSINQTLARSINTSLTTLITLVALFMLGGESIKWFVFALIVGIIVGTYSSIFLATPLLVVWHKKK